MGGRMIKTGETNMNERNNRGQTLIDYTFGITIFLLAVILSFTLVPSLFAPYTSQGYNVVASDRVSDSLTKGVLLEDDNPERYVLDGDCTAHFFAEVNDSDNPSDAEYPADGCRYDDSEAQLNEIAPVRSELDSDLRNTEIIVTEYGSNSPAEVYSSTTGNYITMEATGNISDSSNVYSTYRNVNINGENYRMIVRVGL